MHDLDQRVRLAAFKWLKEQVRVYGDVLPRSILSEGFEFENRRVLLVGPQGIFKPKLLSQIPLSITTAPHGPYDDSFGPDVLLMYRYRGTDPQHQDNAGLRMALFRKAPLVYFHGIVPGKYLAVWRVFIVGDDPDKLTFKVAVDGLSYAGTDWQAELGGNSLSESASQGRMAYLTTAVRQRLHQRGFRERVLRADREQCAFCRLRHLELLDAAHIIPDSEPDGLPVVKTGSLFASSIMLPLMAFLLSVRPDYVIEVRKDILREKDGPMLIHWPQGLHLKQNLVPSPAELRPSPDLLDRRYQRFRAVAW